MNKILNLLPFSRSVLSRAELEAIPLDNNLKEDVVKGKVSLFYVSGGGAHIFSCSSRCMGFYTCTLNKVL